MRSSRKQDGDLDADNNDDDSIRQYGHAASATTRKAVTALLTRYYAAAAAVDAPTICSLLGTTVLAGVASEAEPGGPGRGARDSCAAAIAGLLKYALGRSDVSVGRVGVVGVRVDGAKALAIVRLPSGEERYMPVGRKGGYWKLDALFDMGTI